MILFGWKDVVTDNYVITDKRLCRHCNNVTEWQIAKITTWFDLFFVPVFPIQKQYLLACPICSYRYTQNQDQFSELVKRKDSFPIELLNAERNPLKSILFTVISIGIYFFVLMHSIAKSVNALAAHHDKKGMINIVLFGWFFGAISRTITIVLFSVLGIEHTFYATEILLNMVFVIPLLVWLAMLSARMGNELERREIDYSFGVQDVLLYFILGSLVLVGPFFFIHKVVTASNMLAEHYNRTGS